MREGGDRGGSVKGDTSKGGKQGQSTAGRIQGGTGERPRDISEGRL